jgi:predicted methyltransferase
MIKTLITSIFISLNLGLCAYADDALRTVIASSNRTPDYVVRDKWRHPYETLTFFGIQPNSTVVELSPGAGWYTEILAPYLRDKGKLILGADDPQSTKPEAVKYFERINTKLKSSPHLFDKVSVGVFAPVSKLNYAAPDSVDLVLTFRNIHNWMSDGDVGVRAVFDSVFRSLKKGGVFGVVEHRLPIDRIQDATGSSGYVHQSYVVKIATEAGFKLLATSEINANPLDTANHVGGVWALPPGFVNKSVDKPKYEAIGESDRMTLKFVKL